MKSAPSTRASSRASWLLALAASTLAACASVDNDELTAARQSWRGATYDEVLKAWGAPTQSGVDTHSWLMSETRIQQAGGGGVGGVIFAPPARCDRTLAFRDGRVVDERWIGDPAACRLYARRK